MNQDIRFCTTSDNVKLAYAVSGEGPPLLMPATWLSHLEHQWDSLAWRHWLETLSQKYTLLRYNSRGCGLSDRAPAELSFDGLDAATSKPSPTRPASGNSTCVAICWGGPIGDRICRAPSRNGSRVSCFTAPMRWGGCAAKSRSKPSKRAFCSTWCGSAGASRTTRFCQVWGNYFQPGGTLEHLRSWSEQQALVDIGADGGAPLQIGWQTDVRAAARKIKCPTLAMHVARDTAVPIEDGRKLATLIPDCRFVQIDGENHMPLADEPAWRADRRRDRQLS